MMSGLLLAGAMSGRRWVQAPLPLPGRVPGPGTIPSPGRSPRPRRRRCPRRRSRWLRSSPSSLRIRRLLTRPKWQPARPKRPLGPGRAAVTPGGAAGRRERRAVFGVDAGRRTGQHQRWRAVRARRTGSTRPRRPSHRRRAARAPRCRHRPRIRRGRRSPPPALVQPSVSPAAGSGPITDYSVCAAPEPSLSGRPSTPRRAITTPR